MKKLLTSIFLFILSIIFAFSLGALSAIYGTSNGIEPPLGIVLGIIIGFILHVAFHEFGHLVGGILSGYTFSSYRIFNFIWVNIDGKIKFKKQTVAGTAGQCLMILPNKPYDEIPYFLYNVLGGVFNIILSLLAIIPIILFQKTIIATIFIVISLIGFLLAIQNLVPLKIGGFANDGMNILQCKKSKTARESFFRILQTVQLISSGYRLKDFPSEVFIIKKGSEKTDTLSANIYTNFCLKSLDELNFEKFIELTDGFLKDNDELLDVLKNQLINDKIFSLIMLNKDKDEIEKLLTKDFKKFQKVLIKSNLGFLRTNYALNKCIYNNEKKAKKDLELFNKIIKTHPYKGDIESEMELISELDKLYL